MSVGRICTRHTFTATPEDTVLDVARRMADRRVGTLVVVDEDNVPAGLVTDRDVVVRCVAEGIDPEWTSVTEIMSHPPSTVREDTPIETALQSMAAARVRRSIVVDAAGALVGILSIDDTLELIAEETEAIGKLIRGQEMPVGR